MFSILDDANQKKAPVPIKLPPQSNKFVEKEALEKKQLEQQRQQQALSQSVNIGLPRRQRCNPDAYKLNDADASMLD